MNISCHHMSEYDPGICDPCLEELEEEVEGASEEDYDLDDDGSLTYAAKVWMEARGIASVDAWGRYVYEED